MPERKKNPAKKPAVKGAAKSPARVPSSSPAGAKTSSKAKAAKTRAAKPKAMASARVVGDWREDALARLRALLFEAVPDLVEERKWIKPTNPEGVAAWSKDGLVATGEKYKGLAKITFARGASLPDPSNLFNAGLDGGTRRAIDLREGQSVDARAFKALVKAAVAFNQRPR